MAVRPEPQLKRQIGLYAATAITVGNIVGSGIFKSPNSVAQLLDSAPAMVAAWVIGGALSLCGSLALVELAVAYPRTGGLYVFIREAFGDAWAFVFGWANFWVIKPTLIAAITFVFAEYFCDAVGLPRAALLPAGAAAILLLTGVNALGVRQGAGTASLFTTLKLLGIAALCAAAFLLPHAPAATAPAAAAADVARPLWLAMALAMIPVLFAYDGWTDATYVGGEILAPRRNLPIAIVWGTVLVIAVYVVTNLAYFRVLSPAEVAAAPVVGAEAMERILGGPGRRALAVLVAVSAFGTVNGAILTGPRVTLAMAADGLLWRPLAHVDARRGSPDRALWAQAALSCLWLWVASSFEDVSGWFVTTMWSFYGVTIAALFVQRRRERAARGTARAGDAPPPAYRTPLYPLTPALFILATVAIVASDLVASGWRAAAGVIVAALGSSSFHPVGAVQATLQGRHRLQGRETTATSFFFMAGQLGHFIGPVMTGLILAWKGLPAMIILPIVSIPIGFAIAYQLRHNHPHPKAKGEDGRIRVQAAWSFIILLALVATLQSWSQANMINFFPKYLKDMGLSAITYGNIAGLFMGGSALGNVIGGYFGDRFTKGKVAALALLLASAPIFIMSQIGWSPWLYVLIPLAGAGTGSVHSIMVVLAQRITSGGMPIEFAVSTVMAVIPGLEAAYRQGVLGIIRDAQIDQHIGETHDAQADLARL